MADIQLSFAMMPYDRILPLITGEVKPDGVTLDYAGMPGSIPRVFYEQIKYQRYDVSEMSMSSYLRLRPTGWPYRLLPVFHNRSFSYAGILIRTISGIRQNHPEDLKGKSFGIGDYQQSVGLWLRGILQMEYGIKPEDMVWYQERSEHFSHTGASAELGLKIPSAIKLNYARSDLGSLLTRGELDSSAPVALGASAGSGIDRSHTDISGNSEIKTLFSNPRQEAIRFFQKTGVFPPHHLTVVRESILEEHPWVAISLMEAFEESKRIAIERLRRLPPSLMCLGEYYLEEINAIFGLDPYAYGIKANAKAFDMAQNFSVQQGLTERKQPLEEMFPQEIIYREERLN
jgi:4,5-dihydroxyphthalate decarboxylase